MTIGKCSKLDRYINFDDMLIFSHAEMTNTSCKRFELLFGWSALQSVLMLSFLLEKTGLAYTQQSLNCALARFFTTKFNTFVPHT